MTGWVSRVLVVVLTLFIALSASAAKKSTCTETCGGITGSLTCEGNAVATCGCSSGGTFNGICREAELKTKSIGIRREVERLDQAAPATAQARSAGATATPVEPAPTLPKGARMAANPACKFTLSIEPEQRRKIARLLQTLDRRAGDAMPIAKAYRQVVAAVDRKNTDSYITAFNALQDALEKASPETRDLVSQILR